MQSIFSKISNICKVFFNICKYFFNICKVLCQNLLLTLMFFHWAFLVSRFNAKYSFSKFASIINVFPLGFYRVRVQCKVFFGSVSKQGKSGKYIFFDHFPKPKGGIKLVLKVNQYIYKYWDGSAVWNKGRYFDEKSTNKW